ncbi:MAG TPA: hypothetical protein VHE37_03195 [Nevskiaceae bacterium]|nr:hypothetical protein [Nevskiaceae bacterium]
MLVSAALGLLAATAGCSHPPPCTAGDRDCARAAIRNHPARRIEFWNRMLSRPLVQRIGPAPQVLLDYLVLDNTAQGVPDHPHAPRLSAEFLADLHDAFEQLPPAVTDPLARRLAGIYLVDGLGRSAYTEDVLDESGEPVAAVIVLDAQMLSQRKANAWASWKENTPFTPEDGWALHAEIERPEQDNERSAIQYILLHELGHAISVGRHLHPAGSRPPPKTTGDFAFFELSWKVLPQGEYESLFSADFPQRRDVTYYFGARLAASQMLPVYQALQRTNYPTLYAATSPGDDFAESFANYVHVVMLHRPYTIHIAHAGEPVHDFGACWNTARCRAKRRLIEQLLDAG